ncbi:DUF6122 family protein [Pseudozobellia thermophila]|uniref:LexA-binding, inner membrane-associated hydrolase n=1 Tax=Pseudozobellia thermophila TaxID=192903 RepID=A0A1M6J2B6_9FLAO|nr:DUF6122 family protein [Pseudozobellia thermophila]SHJ40883.1 hypothetical protein SAMN04488513_104216 [Pseudozobellia thermophila]
MLRFMVHYGIHFLVPIAVGLIFFKKDRFVVILVLLAGIVIDIDHLLAVPVFDPDRCSIGFHPLHSYGAMVVYALLFVFRKTRLYGLALLIHILADSTDCYLMLQGK